MDYKIAIPSYKRSNIIKDKTLKLLNDYGIDKNRITIFVANKDAEKLYKKALYNKYKIVVGVPTLNAQRSFITKYYPKGTRLMQFDDDLTDCLIKLDDKNLVPIKDLEKEFIEKGFKICEKLKSNFFGYYAVPNPFFMKKRIQTKLCYVCGGAFGEILTRDAETGAFTSPIAAIMTREHLAALKAIDKEDFAGIETDNPERLGADYVQFIAPLIKAVQELSEKVEKLENK